MRPLATFLTLLLLLGCSQTLLLTTPIDTPTPVRTAYSEKAMVVSAHPLATQAGLKILEAGGNAYDAAVAVQFALAVVLPAAGNIGGGGFLVGRDDDGSTYALDYRETAPLAAHRDMYLDDDGQVIQGLSREGHLSAGVPGTVDGMVQLYDSLSALQRWDLLVQPAIDLAAQGFKITAAEAGGLNRLAERFRKYNPASCPLIKADGLWQEGDVLLQTELAETLQRISDEGREGFYGGLSAKYLLAEMKDAPIQEYFVRKDLNDYRAKWRTPIECNYRGYKVHSMPPPSSGGIALCQLLQLVEPYPLEDYGFQSAESMHLIIEAERRVYADRAEHLGDADFYPVPVDGLLDPAYLQQRMSDFDPERATSSTDISAGAPSPRESEETTHYSIVDTWGNAVSVTTTLNGGYGSGVWVEGAGYLLNNEMDDFSAKPGAPNLYGLVGNEANSIAAGKRMLSSMTPTVVSQDGALRMVVGTPGGSTIITSVFQTMINVLDYDMTMSEAVQAGRFHHQWTPDKVFYERGKVSEDTLYVLGQMGHSVNHRGGIGRVDAILVGLGGELEGAADPRGDDHAQGL